MNYIAILQEQVAIMQEVQSGLLKAMKKSIPHMIIDGYRELAVQTAQGIRETIKLISALEEREEKLNEIYNDIGGIQPLPEFQPGGY